MQMAYEASPQYFFGRNSTLLGFHLDGEAAGLDESARLFEADSLQCVSGRSASLSVEEPCERPRRHAETLSNLLDGEGPSEHAQRLSEDSRTLPNLMKEGTYTTHSYCDTIFPHIGDIFQSAENLICGLISRKDSCTSE